MSESEIPIMISKVWYKGEGVNNGKILIGEADVTIRVLWHVEKMIHEILILILKDCFKSGNYIKNIELITKEEYEELEKMGN